MSNISFTEITDGSTIDASDVNGPLNTIYDDYNGGIDSNNLATNAVTTAKITDANVTMPKISNPYKFSVYRNAAWNTPNAAEAKITHDTEVYDTNNNFSAGTYTVPVTGYYHFDAHVENAANLTTLLPEIYVNGALKKRGTWAVLSTCLQGQSVSCDLYLAANDTVENYVYASAAVAGATGITKTYFSGHLICI